MNRIRPPCRGLHGASAALLAAFSFALPLEAAASPPVPSGLAFALTLSNGGRSVSGDRFSLKVPGTKGALVLSLEGIDLFGGTLVSAVRLKNDLDADLYALRVDLVSVTETSRQGDAKDVSRVLPASAASPPAWDVVPKGTESTAQLFRVSPIGFAPETTLVIVLGAVSGVASAGSFEVEGAGSPAAVDSDPSGSIYVTDVSGKVFRTDSDGKGAGETKARPASRPPAPDGACSRHRAAGHSCRVAFDGSVWAIEEREVSQFDAEGRRVRSFRPGGEGPPVGLAFGKGGRLYVVTSGEEGRKGSVRVFRPF